MSRGVTVSVKPDIPLPSDICRRISIRAAYHARRLAPRSQNPGPHGARFIRPTWRKFEIGVYVGGPGVHLLFPNWGIRAFNMYALEGKTIPIRTPGGVIFRKARNVGQRTISARDEQGRIVASKIRWRHPGIRPMYFLEQGIIRAVREWRRNATPQEQATALQALLAKARQELEGEAA